MASKKKSFFGSPYRDTIPSSVASDGKTREVYALDGDDSIDVSYYSNYSLVIYAGNGDDTYDCEANAYYFTKKGKNKAKYGPRFYGEAGNDRIFDSVGGTALIDGGDGDDVIQYHGNKGGSSAYKKGSILIDGGTGNDNISYWTLKGIRADVHGGDGDDLIGVGTNISGYSALRQYFFGDGGNDTFYTAKPPSDIVTYFDGGDGYDVFYLNGRYRTSIVKRSTTDQGEILTFAMWQKNGVTYETSIILKGFEQVGYAGEFVPYKYGTSVIPYGSDAGTVSELWTDNQGFA